MVSRACGPTSVTGARDRRLFGKLDARLNPLSLAVNPSSLRDTLRASLAELRLPHRVSAAACPMWCYLTSGPGELHVAMHDRLGLAELRARA